MYKNAPKMPKNALKQRKCIKMEKNAIKKGKMHLNLQKKING